MGQRRLDDGNSDYRLSGLDYPPSHHHHSMQHKQLNDLQHEEGGGGTGSQPYSRTPELRVSHKLAERKRRTEMKELFDQLRDLMPQERGSKASKWEILTKAIAEHQRQADHIRMVQSHYSTAMAENEILRRELQALRMESAHLRGELNSSAGHQQPPPPPGAQAGPGAYSDQYSHAPQTKLPPLHAISNGIPSGPDSMTGVQYETHRSNGYRSDRY
ncbi:Protein esc1 [Escovopsis weberi]|uniref:Protein esc1 n=1 Tax=Escovopsis weberi TaxID=150374 RepID=A0A0M9VV37_ESCWE|nr:Protein esc1 [Escovopsis weberi]